MTHLEHEDPDHGPARYRIDQLASLLSGGERLRGGCADCDAYQTVQQTRDSTYVVRVHHDDHCPYLHGVTR
jgi:hypothetical protein